MADDGALSSVNISLQNIEENLERFISYDRKHSATILSVLRDVFNHNKKDEAICGRKIEGCPFESLQLDPTSFDNETIWQQIQLQNESLLPKIQTEFKPLLRKADSVQLNDIKNTNNGKYQDNFTEINMNRIDFVQGSTDSSSDVGSEVEKFVEQNSNDSDELPKAIKGTRLKPKGTCKLPKGSVVDDQFFKLAEMEKFLESKHGGGDVSADDSDENFDYFADLNERGDGTADIERNDPKGAMYSDYFDAPDDLSGAMRDDGKDCDDNMDDIETDEDSSDNEETAANEFNISGDDNDGDNDDDPKSTLEKQQEKVKKQIAALEDSNVAAKSWQLTGEASAFARPSNSLLEEVLQFDHTSAAAPVITEETSKTLEDIIIQRIKDGAWDDVERKEKPVKEPYEYKKAQPINQEKSKMSLSEIYEKEYLQQQNPEVEKENEEHAQIKKLMKSLFFKLDSLSNFHFTPKPLKSEVTIVSNVPSVTIEECTPVNVSETALLAPEEVYDKQRVEVKSQGEMTKQDRNRERRVKKRRQRLAAKEKEKIQKAIERTNPGLGNKYSKAKAMESLKKDKTSTIVGEKRRDSSLTSSSGFFNKLQDSVREEIHKKSQNGKKERKNKTSSAHCRL
ncbi:U3 small nucleolar ribonucleo MPP10 [Paramuricea clavata]|uniref:U3 small nucleolar ribonucleoprotein protein MPP10 n=1 Tax=Paramuricea clavata TaxID=317549 RepID=A0A6S7IDG8_PARCT|nr:U3 small nucleolar ribonucleo MPP10 [Paramuricea clavata]